MNDEKLDIKKVRKFIRSIVGGEINKLDNEISDMYTEKNVYAYTAQEYSNILEDLRKKLTFLRASLNEVDFILYKKYEEEDEKKEKEKKTVKYVEDLINAANAVIKNHAENEENPKIICIKIKAFAKEKVKSEPKKMSLVRCTNLKLGDVSIDVECLDNLFE